MAERGWRLAAFMLAGFGAVFLIGAGWTPDVKPDADAYWLAAQRVREGLPLYAASYADDIEIYRYAPWFAYAWVPLTYLPQDLAYAIWRALLVIAGAAAVLTVLRARSPAALTLSLLMAGLLASALPAANVTILIVGALAVALPTRAGPLVLGVAGSLKGFPLLLVAGYLAERRWRDATVAMGVAGLLWAQALLFDLRAYPTVFGGVGLYRLAPVLWPVVAAVVAVGLIVLVTRGSRWTWLAAAAAIPVLVPRVWLPDAAYVLVAASVLLNRRSDRLANKGLASHRGTPRTSQPSRPGPL
jgi:hypothetical protein